MPFLPDPDSMARAEYPRSGTIPQGAAHLLPESNGY